MNLGIEGDRPECLWSRRQFLAGFGSVSALSVSGCASESGQTPTNSAEEAGTEPPPSRTAKLTTEEVHEPTITTVPPSETPAPTVSPTPTASPTPTVSPTPTASPTPTQTPTPKPIRFFKVNEKLDGSPVAFSKEFTVTAESTFSIEFNTTSGGKVNVFVVTMADWNEMVNSDRNDNESRQFLKDHAVKSLSFLGVESANDQVELSPTTYLVYVSRSDEQTVTVEFTAEIEEGTF